MAERVLWTGDGLNLNVGQQVIFKQAFISIAETERVALVGRNGCGKTTLLNVIAGIEQPSSGKISMARNLRISYMPQNFDVSPGMNARDVVRQGLKYYEDLLKQYESLPAHSPEYESTADLLTIHDAWNPEQKLNMILSKLHLDKTIGNCDFNSLSGGEQRRVILARSLIAEPDLLLLDEPTNHLDVDTICWIEDFLASYKGACLFVTHDRYFLDRIATRIVELDHGSMYSIDGNYADFLQAKADREYREDVME